MAALMAASATASAQSATGAAEAAAPVPVATQVMPPAAPVPQAAPAAPAPAVAAPVVTAPAAAAPAATERRARQRAAAPAKKDGAAVSTTREVDLSTLVTKDSSAKPVDETRSTDRFNREGVNCSLYPARCN